MFKAFKYKLNPNKEQSDTLTKWMGCSRYIWNFCLDENNKQYQLNKHFIFQYDLNMKLPKLKKLNTWLADVPSQALQQRIIDFESALKKFLKDLKSDKKIKAGFPTHRKKQFENHSTIRIPQDQKAKSIKPTKKQIKIPKLGWIDWKRYRPLEGQLKSITIKKENGFWFCICLCEIPDTQPITTGKNTDVVGIDLGLKDFAITSDGEVFATSKLYRNKQKKLKRTQRKLKKKIIGSKNREKQKKKLNKVHYKIKCQRYDFTHKISSSITKNYLFVGVEDLNIAGMMQNNCLAKAIQDQGWGMFLKQLDYKSRYNGGLTVKIDRFAPSTKICSNCHHKQPMPLSVRIYDCHNCGHLMDRDLNAAINIQTWAIDNLNRCGTHRIQLQSLGLEAATSLESQ